MSSEWLDPYSRPLYRLPERHWNQMSVYANEEFYTLDGFAKVVGAIDGSLVPIIERSNASVHPSHEYGATSHLSSFVFLLFLLPSASLCTLYSTLTPMRCTMLLLLYPIDPINDLIWLVITLPNNSLLPTLSKVLNLPHICIRITICHNYQW